MFGSSMLDIAIGIIFVFLLLSIFATSINELIQSVLRARGKLLLGGIQSLLNDVEGTGLLEKVYNHGQIFGLYQGPFDLKKPKNLPSYIPAKNFALALLDAVVDTHKAAATVTANADARADAAAANQPAPPIQPAPTGGNSIAVSVEDCLTIGQEVKDAANALAKNKLTEKVGKPLVSMIAMAGNDNNKLQKNIEDWYNSGMDRVSGRYKSRIQTALFIIGISMAVFMNANTIAIVRQLSKDPTLRQAMVAAAQSAKDPRASTPAQPQTSAQPDAQTAATPAASGTPAPSANTDPAIRQQIDATRKAFDNINSLGIPLGWPNGEPHTLKALRHNLGSGAAWSALIQDRAAWEALIGWLLTAFAVTLGAPFWFDMLNKIMVVRSTVKPEEKSKTEGSKD